MLIVLISVIVAFLYHKITEYVNNRKIDIVIFLSLLIFHFIWNYYFLPIEILIAISLVRNYIRNYGLRRVTSAIAGAAARYVGVRVANRVAGFALSAINGFAAWMSIGDAITTIWANNDVNRRDPNLNALW